MDAGALPSWLHEEHLAGSWDASSKAYKVPNGESSYLISAVQKDGTVYVSFPGTNNVRDWVIDADFATVRAGETVLKGSKLATDVVVHKGFNHRLETVLTEDFKKQLDTATAGAQQVVFAGHSLGGAVAVLATIWFLQTRQIRPDQQVACVTFGCPFVGNDKFAEEVQGRGWQGMFVHIVSRHDIVPRLLIAKQEALGNIGDYLKSFLSVTDRMSRRRLVPDSLDPEGPVTPQEATKAAEASQTLVQRVLKVGQGLLLAGKEAGAAAYRLPFNIVKGAVDAGANVYRPFGTYIMHTETGTASPISDPAVALHLLLVTLQQRSHAVGIDGTAVVNEHMLSRYKMSVDGDMAINLKQPKWKSIEAFYQDAENAAVLAMMMALKDINKGVADVGERVADVNANVKQLAAALSEGVKSQDFGEYWRTQAQAASDKLQQWVYQHSSSDAAYQHFRMSPKGLGPTNDIDILRRALMHFWARAVELHDEGRVPDGTFRKGSAWLQYGDSYRQNIETLDIANYYRLKLWIKSGPYLSKLNRPAGYRFLEETWGREYGRDEVADTTSWARKEQQYVDDADAALKALHVAAVDAAPLPRKQALLRVQRPAEAAVTAVTACRLPKTEALLKAKLRKHRIVGWGLPIGGPPITRLPADVAEVQAQFWTQACENTGRWSAQAVLLTGAAAAGAVALLVRGAMAVGSFHSRRE